MAETKKRGEIIQLDDDLECIIADVDDMVKSVGDLMDSEDDLQIQIASMEQRINDLLDSLGVNNSQQISEDEVLFLKLDNCFESLYKPNSTIVRSLPALAPEEWVFAAITGIVSIGIDVVFVGTPEVVKIYRGGENFDGSKLTNILRSVGTDPDSKGYAIFHWLSDKCIVPYDISAEKGVVTPNNHRLRGFAHDPFLGLFFAVADILLGTTTCIDNNGKLRILIGKHQAITSEKFLAVFYYIGHIISDLCTARGVPVPGCFLTQFFTGEGSSSSIAKVAERMYYDGYDLRHMGSMTVPVMVKDLLIEAYLRINEKDEVVSVRGIAESEISKQQYIIKKDYMLFISDCVATTGNIAKVLAPPSCGNPASINMVQWYRMLNHGFELAKASTRDLTTENVINTRRDIDATWERLLDEQT